MKKIRKISGILLLMAASAWPATAQKAEYFTPYKETQLRMPSVPLLVNDPYFSIWSNTDNLYDSTTKLWCEKEKAVDGILRVDGVAYRFLGKQREHVLKPIFGMTVDGVQWEGRVSRDTQDGTAWTTLDFDDSEWALQKAAWGTPGEYPNVQNPWKETHSDIYVRREINLTADDIRKDLWVMFSHDDVFEIYINGVKITSTGETWLQGEEAALPVLARLALKEGRNVLAAHCHNTSGGAYIDFGLYENMVQEGSNVINAVQKDVDVMATSSYYTFECGPVDLEVVFTAPMLIDDLDLISTPINYISYKVKSRDGAKHDVQFYFGTTPQLTVNEMSQPTLSNFVTEEGVRYIKSGSEAQPVLGRAGDVIAIDWGYLYIPEVNGKLSISDELTAENTFATTGKLPASATSTVRSTNHSNMPTLMFMNDLGSVDEAMSYMMVGYDEVYDIQYMRQNYKAYYARNGKTIFQAFNEFRDNYDTLMERCRALDKRIYDDGEAAGDAKYAEQLSGLYRHVMAAHKLFEDNTGKALYFSKENRSNGCVNTVDLTYPESPLYLLYNPELQKGMVLSILDYALSDARKDKNCAAHDLGTYPHANGQVYGDTMPLEESANIVILVNAISRITGDWEWARPYRTTLRSWASYCHTEGQNPGNQLCTDDFKGPSEQNTNLSVKAILAVAAYAEIAEHIGGSARDPELFRTWAKNMALIWEGEARDGDHYRMMFNRGGTWSMKYNMLWDKMWGLQLFPEEVMEREFNFYNGKMKRYGLPLDNRDNQTKSDWMMWIAAMTPSKADFLKYSDYHYKYMNETRSRRPTGDWYYADSGEALGFTARSVMGGVWARVLMDRDKVEIPAPEGGWEIKGNHIKTRWAEDVTPDNALPEYPRPQMEREQWMNLNGLWDYAIANSVTSVPEDYNGKILVPFAIESSLSGVMKPLEPGKILWYRREVSIPDDWAGKRVMINFGAVDNEAWVYVNGTESKNLVGNHRGGYSAFSFDITDYITDGKATIYVKVRDNTTDNGQPLGKQRRYPDGNGSIFYTSVSGIWQTVWLEPVEPTHIATMKITPDVDASKFTFDIALEGTPSGKITVTLADNGNEVASQTIDAAASNSIELSVSAPKLWSPASPFLYDVNVTLADGDNTLDAFNSYAALRKISYRKTEEGDWRFQLNNQDLYQFGPLDQGYWPDGLYTAPTDEALAFDLEKTKEWGFNMVRKHMKTEPDRWYYHCDRLGLMVWQDMPSQFNNHEGWVTDRYYEDHNCTQSRSIERMYRAEWKEIIDQLYSHPSIVVWTPFNEAWGQFDTEKIAEYTRQLDATRLINPASGGNHYHTGEGTFVDQHSYAQPLQVFEGIFDASRPFVIGEYGGLGRNITAHRWYERNSQTYNTYGSTKSITDAYVKLVDQLVSMAKGYKSGDNTINWCAAVYTQTTDVETEVNGIMTYDREVDKFDVPRIREAADKLTKVYGEYDGIENVTAGTAEGPVEYYDLMGVRLSAPRQGINIVRRADGTAEKIVNK